MSTETTILRFGETGVDALWLKLMPTGDRERFLRQIAEREARKLKGQPASVIAKAIAEWGTADD